MAATRAFRSWAIVVASIGRSVTFIPVATAKAQILRADFNGDTVTDISNPTSVPEFLFAGGSTRHCPTAGNSNDDALLDISDPIYTFNRLFANAEPPLSFPESSDDHTPDGLACY